MSYEPTVWKDGDLVTSAKLNKLEQGVANGGGNGMVLLHVVQNGTTLTYTLDKTWQEIWDNNYTIAYADMTSTKDFYQIDTIDSTDYSVFLRNAHNNFQAWLMATSADDYPTLDRSNGGGEK